MSSRIVRILYSEEEKKFVVVQGVDVIGQKYRLRFSELVFSDLPDLSHTKVFYLSGLSFLSFGSYKTSRDMLLVYQEGEPFWDGYIVVVIPYTDDLVVLPKDGRIVIHYEKEAVLILKDGDYVTVTHNEDCCKETFEVTRVGNSLTLSKWM